MFTVYILVNSENRTYVGFSGNFEVRFNEHNNPCGKKKGWTRIRGPWSVLHTEGFTDKTIALKREKELKTGKGRDFIKRLIQKKMSGSPPRRSSSILPPATNFIHLCFRIDVFSYDFFSCHSKPIYKSVLLLFPAVCRIAFGRL